MNLDELRAERERTIAAFLADPPLDAEAALAFLWGPHGGSSAERAHLVADWAWSLPEDAAAGRTFWTVVQQMWPSFDRIPHDSFAGLFAEYADQWSPNPGLMSLPRRMTAYRGQSADNAAGLSWTLARTVAVEFAQGHRGLEVPNPVVLERAITRDDVVMAFFEERAEAEIVLWTAPEDLSRPGW